MEKDFDWSLFIDRLWERENAKGKKGVEGKGGYRKGKYYPYEATNGKDIGPGLDLSKQTDEFRKRAERGLTKKELDTIVKERLEKEKKYFNQRIAKEGGDTLKIPENVYGGLYDMYWQIGNGLYQNYPKFWKGVAQNDYDKMQKESATYYEPRKGAKISKDTVVKNGKVLDEGRWNFRKQTYFNDPSQSDQSTTTPYNDGNIGEFVKSLPYYKGTPMTTPYNDGWLPGKKADGGPLNTAKMWNELSISEKSNMIRTAVRNGITNLNDIKAKYNEFAEGGPEDEIGIIPSDNTRVAPILNNPPKSREIRRGDFLYTPAHLELTENGFKTVPASRRMSMIPLKPVYPEFDIFMLGRAAVNAASKAVKLNQAIEDGFKSGKVVTKPVTPKVIQTTQTIKTADYPNIFAIKNDIDFYNAANEFAQKYGYQTFDKSLLNDRNTLEAAVKKMFDRHNTFFRGVMGDDATKRIAVDTPWKEGEGIWISPEADYAQLYGKVGKLQRPYTLSDNRMNWFKDADFDYGFADDNIGLINPWQRNPKLYGDIIIDKSIPHELYAKDKLNFVDWIDDINNAVGSRNVMTYRYGGPIVQMANKFGGTTQ